METNSKIGLFKHTVFICSTSCLFYLYVYIFMEICSLSFCIALWDIYYVHLVWEDIENDLNRIMDFLINLWDSFQIYFLNFINVLAMVFPWRQLIRLMNQRVKKSDSKMCYIP